MLALAKAKKGKGQGAGQKQDALYHGDLGPNTPAQWRHARPIPDHSKGGYGRIKQREPMHQILCRTDVISVRERDAAATLLDAWESTRTTGEVSWARPFVDGGRVSGGVVSRLSEQEHYNLLMGQIPDDCQFCVGVIVLQQRRLSEYANRGEGRKRAKEQLKRGLRALADYLRY